MTANPIVLSLDGCAERKTSFRADAAGDKTQYRGFS